MNQIAVCRDPQFWRHIASFPEVDESLRHGVYVVDPGALCTQRNILPLSSEHGGFFCCQLDMTGRIFEIHAMFTREAWGREVADTAKQCMRFLFNATDAQMLIALEPEMLPRAAPPKSHGWRLCGDYNGAEVSTRLWYVTRAAWFASPACRRMIRCLS